MWPKKAFLHITAARGAFFLGMWPSDQFEFETLDVEYVNYFKLYRISDIIQGSISSTFLTDFFWRTVFGEHRTISAIFHLNLTSTFFLAKQTKFGEIDPRNFQVESYYYYPLQVRFYEQLFIGIKRRSY